MDEVTRSFWFVSELGFKELLNGERHPSGNCPQHGYTPQEIADHLRIHIHYVNDFILKYKDEIEPVAPDIDDGKGARYRWKKSTL
jgi:hypothetical protein